MKFKGIKKVKEYDVNQARILQIYSDSLMTYCAKRLWKI